MDKIFIDFDSEFSRVSKKPKNGCELSLESGVRLISSGIEHNFYKPKKILLKFDEDRDEYLFTSDQIISITQYFFKEFYYCGDIILNEELDEEYITIYVRRTAESKFERNDMEIRFDKSTPNILEFVHELIHAIIILNGCDCGYHREGSSRNQSSQPLNHACTHLNVFDEGAPGMILDLKTLFQMNNLDTTNLPFNKVNLPFITSEIYPTIHQYCTSAPTEAELVNYSTDQSIDPFPFLLSHHENTAQSYSNLQLGNIQFEETIVHDRFNKGVKQFFNAKSNDEYQIFAKILQDNAPLKLGARSFAQKSIETLEKRYINRTKTFFDIKKK